MTAVMFIYLEVLNFESDIGNALSSYTNTKCKAKSYTDRSIINRIISKNKLIHR